MEVRQLLRLIVFGYFSFLPNLLSYWVAVVLPEVIQRNLGVTDPSLLSEVAGYFYSTYFLGLIAGTFAWPYLIRVLSKRAALLIGLFFQGVFTLATGLTANLPLLYACRFLTGFFNNLNTVGKDFIFEFAKPEYRQYAFSLKSSFTMLGMWVGPLMGYYVYALSGHSFAWSMGFLAGLYLLACVLFVIFFYIDFSPLEMDAPVKVSVSLDDLDHHKLARMEDEENARLRDAAEERRRKESKGLVEVMRIVWKAPLLRNFTLVYLITNGVGTTKNVVLVFYMEAAWRDGGLGATPVALSLVNLAVFVACLLFLLVSPAFVPSRMSYLGITRWIVLLTILTMPLAPLLRDTLRDNTQAWSLLAIYTCYGVTSFFNQKLFSPFVNFYLNDNVDKSARTAMNAISFVGSCLAATVTMLAVAPFLSLSLYHPAFTQYAPYNKYFVFLILDLLLGISMIFLRKPKEGMRI